MINRITLRLLVILLLLSLSGWLGFKIWLSNQPEDFQQQVNELSTAEFWRHVIHMLAPAEKPDLGAWQRREYAGKGHSPWVMRSSLDKQPRMLNLAMAPGYWLSYNLERAAPYQLWKGELNFAGPVFGTAQGDSPSSSGAAYFRRTSDALTEHNNTPSSDWRLGGQSAEKVQFLGYRFNDEHIFIDIQLSNELGTVKVQESPRLTFNDDSLVFERKLRILSNPNRLSISAFTGEGIWSDAPVSRYGEPPIAIADNADQNATQTPPEQGEALIAKDDCLSCHNQNERVVGPSWKEVAQRYASSNGANEITNSMVNGSVGKWGNVPMPAHSELDAESARQMADFILAVDAEPSALPKDVVELRERFDFTYDAISPNKPKGLHPSLRKTSLLLPGFTPAVSGLAKAENGDLLVTTWDSDGAVYRIKHWQEGQPEVTRIAEGLHEPLGLAVWQERLFVMQKQELTELVDNNGDGIIDYYKSVNASWPATSNFHEFGFGLAQRGRKLIGGLSVCVLEGGKSCPNQAEGRGRIFQVDANTGHFETLASGMRTPNGLGVDLNGELFVTDNQGDWLPASELNHVTSGGFYGFGGRTDDAGKPAKPPALWLPQNEIGNSPTEPLFPTEGPYRGQVIFGDIYNGGLKRGFLEKVGGLWQGAAFHFSEGLAAPVNRIEAVDQGFVVGQIGNPGNWGIPGKPWYGLEKLTWTSQRAFEPLVVKATATGFDIEFSTPLAQDTKLTANTLKAKQWFYYASRMYGGPKYDLSDLKPTNLAISEDRTRLSFDLPNRKKGYVIYLELDPELTSASGEQLWINQVWYTFHQAPLRSAKAQSDSTGSAQNTLTAQQKADGWKRLFNGVDFTGWHLQNTEPSPSVRGWVVENGAMKFTRDISFFRFVLNILNPFTKTPLLDLISNEQYQNFELSIDWKISPGGNSGIFYLLPPSDDRIPWMSNGLEMQVLDNDGHSDGNIIKHRAGDLYDIQASSRDQANPVGQWNTARIRVEGDHIQHWLNGVKVVDVRRRGPAWEALLADSKFSDNPDHGAAERGHILLQDHGNTVWYRNVFIKELD